MSQYQLTNRRGVCYATGSKSDCIAAALGVMGIADKPFLLTSRDINGVTYVGAHAPGPLLTILIISAI